MSAHRPQTARPAGLLLHRTWISLDLCFLTLLKLQEEASSVWLDCGT